MYNSVKCASLKDVQIQIVERTKNEINENDIEYYCLLKKEFNYKKITYKNFNATSVSSGGRVLISEGVVNKDDIISIVLSSIILK